MWSLKTYILEDLQSHFELTRRNIIMKKPSRILKAFLIFPSGFKITCIQNQIFNLEKLQTSTS